MSTALHKEYRPLTAEEISVLREHANSADDWSQVWVTLSPATFSIRTSRAGSAWGSSRRPLTYLGVSQSTQDSTTPTCIMSRSATTAASSMSITISPTTPSAKSPSSATSIPSSSTERRPSATASRSPSSMRRAGVRY